MRVTAVLAASLIWTICKVRNLSAALLLVQNIQKCKAFTTDVPSFIYKSKSDNIVSTENPFTIDITLEHVNLMYYDSTYHLLHMETFSSKVSIKTLFGDHLWN